MPHTHFNDKFIANIGKTARKLFVSGDAVLIAVSGGADSVALLHALTILAPGLSLKLGIAHLNHQLRGENSDKDELFVSELAETLNLPCYLAKEDVLAYQKIHKLSLEEAGRRVRYEFFEKIRKEHGFDKIALGHHADDNAELILMNLLRGSGALGLSGIPSARNGNIVRPLINITRAEIMDFLTRQNLNHVSDDSNSDTRFLRNRIRHELIPILRDYNPGISGNLNRMSAILKSEEEWIESLITPAFEDCTQPLPRPLSETERGDPISEKGNIGRLPLPCREGGRGVRFSLSKLKSLHIAAQRRLIRKAIMMLKGDIRRITFDHIEAVISLSEKNSGSKNIHLPDRIRIEKNNEGIMFIREHQSLRMPESDKTILYCYEILSPGRMFIPEIGATLNFSYKTTEEIGEIYHVEQTLAFFDADVVQFPLHIRNFRPGDRFNPLGVNGTQKLKTYFINVRAAKTDRLQCPLVLCKGEIIWVAGYRTGEFGKITPKTQKVLKAELFSGGSIR
ncbi:MAG: tRNA lysidine(34) synthetase TilS [Desulfobacteraceae bacterium IS3]|nr:MAG: tRNA lysidine(34) synthetase TilS [Desulfobacteraceae bacterium IS3]